MKGISDIVELHESESSLSTIDFLFEVKQTRTRFKQMKQQFEDLKQARELTDRFSFALESIFGDWEELVKYHRKRTLPIMVHHDLLRCGKLQKGAHRYKISVVDHMPYLEQRELIWNKDEKLTEKDRLVTVESLQNTKTCIKTLFHRYFKDSMATMELVKDGVTKVLFLLRHVRLVVKQLNQREDLIHPYNALSNKLLEVLKDGLPLTDFRTRRTQSH